MNDERIAVFQAFDGDGYAPVEVWSLRFVFAGAQLSQHVKAPGACLCIFRTGVFGGEFKHLDRASALQGYNRLPWSVVFVVTLKRGRK